MLSFGDIVTEFAMQSTVNWMDEMSTKFQMEMNSSESITSTIGRSSGIANAPFKLAVIAVGVAGILTNLLVLVGFWIAGRSKMNVSSAYIATIRKPSSDWKRPPSIPNHMWLKAIESDRRPLNIGPSYTWKKPASRAHRRSIVDMATFKKSMP